MDLFNCKRFGIAPIALMKLVSSLVLLSLFLLASGISDDRAPLTVAVMDFVTPEDSEVKGSDAAVLLTSLLSGVDSIQLVERAELSKVLGEMELGLSGTVDSSTAAQVGKLTGAKVIITGRMFSAGKTEFIATKVIGADNGRVFGQVEQYGDSSNFAEAVTKLSEKIGSVIGEKSVDLIPLAESPEARIARLKKLIAGKTLPSVFVSIPEEHVSRQIPDPAAQTEIQKTFQDLGFVLVDNEAAADFVIIGEAFSEMAGRRANLVSCRARVEVKTRQKGKADQIQVERETNVAVDLAENVAAKSALQNAGSSLAERLVLLAVK